MREKGKLIQLFCENNMVLYSKIEDVQILWPNKFTPVYIYALQKFLQMYTKRHVQKCATVWLTIAGVKLILVKPFNVILNKQKNNFENVMYCSCTCIQS